MARKSRKNIAVMEETPAIKVWRAALYIRLSVEFNGKRGDSLETQRCQRRCDFVVFRRTGYVEKWRVMVYSLCIIILAVFVRQA